MACFFDCCQLAYFSPAFAAYKGRRVQGTFCLMEIPFRDLVFKGCFVEGHGVIYIVFPVSLLQIERISHRREPVPLVLWWNGEGISGNGRQ